ncbi:MAG: glycosyltransferase [Flavobacterium sp.]|nr:MAG: glycosyltransferase [Flavobacterium sp.]
MSAKKLLIIGLVWPEPTSSAAGTRMVQLIKAFLNDGFEIIFCCAASKSEFSFNLLALGVSEQQITLNNESFNNFVKSYHPDLVIYDRFVIEEQFGWRVQQECPSAMTILDTEDLHFLRHARQQELKNPTDKEIHLFNDTAKREIASILRCDLSLIISEEEIKILEEKFKIDSTLLHYLPFLEEEITATTSKNWLSFAQREDFVFIGNFLHEPNWHTVQFLKTKIWPVLRKKLPKTKLNIYGAYPSQKVWQLNNEAENFNILGRADDARAVISKHRVLLAPIQFGAGVKGKFIDAMQVGTPSVTTTVGAEAMKGNLDWNGFIANDIETFVNNTVELYQNETLWNKAQQNGIQIINKRYAINKFLPTFLNNVYELFDKLNAHREQNFYGQILKHNTVQSTKYMSLWIEEKNRKKS